MQPINLFYDKARKLLQSLVSQRSGLIDSLQILEKAGYGDEVECCLTLEHGIHDLEYGRHTFLWLKMAQRPHGFWFRTRLMYACLTSNLARAIVLIEKYNGNMYFEGKLKNTALGYSLTRGSDKLSHYMRNRKVPTSPFHGRLQSFVSVKDAPYLELHGHTGSIEAICSLKDGRLVSSSKDLTICIWFDNGGPCQFVLKVKKAADMLREIDDYKLASSSCCGTFCITIWNTLHGTHLFDLSVDNEQFDCKCLLVHNTLNKYPFLIAGTGEISLQAWNIANQKRVDIFYDTQASECIETSACIHCLCAVSDICFVSGSNDGFISVFHTCTDDIVKHQKFCCDRRDCGAVLSIALLPDGRLAVANGDGTVILWTLGNGAKVANYEYLTNFSAGERSDRQLQPTNVFVAPGGYLMVGDRTGMGRVWNYPTRNCILIFGTVDAKAVLCDGRLVCKRTGPNANRKEEGLTIYKPAPTTEPRWIINKDCDPCDLKLLCNLVHGQYATCSNFDNVLRLYRRII